MAQFSCLISLQVLPSYNIFIWETLSTLFQTQENLIINKMITRLGLLSDGQGIFFIPDSKVMYEDVLPVLTGGNSVVNIWRLRLPPEKLQADLRSTNQQIAQPQMDSDLRCLWHSNSQYSPFFSIFRIRTIMQFLCSNNEDRGTKGMRRII